jgi:hypothetical protein
MAAPARSIGMILLAIYLILGGLGLLGVAIPYANYILGVLAIVAGVLLLLGR